MCIYTRLTDMVLRKHGVILGNWECDAGMIWSFGRVELLENNSFGLGPRVFDNETGEDEDPEHGDVRISLEGEDLVVMLTVERVSYDPVTETETILSTEDRKFTISSV